MTNKKLEELLARRIENAKDAMFDKLMGEDTCPDGLGELIRELERKGEI